MSDLNIANISTMYTYVLTSLCGFFLSYLISKGINLPIEAEQLANILGIIIGFLLAHINATNPNKSKLLGNDTDDSC